MKIYTLTESRQLKHGERLSLVADSIVLNLLKNNALDHEEEMNFSLWAIGAVKDWVDSSKLLSDLYTRLRDIKLVIDHNQPTSQALFDPESKAIIMGTQGEADPRSLSSMLVHELRHALDHSLSKGKALKGQGLKGSFTDYLRSDHEINARFTQVLDDLKTVDKSEEMLPTIIDLMDKHKLTDVLPAKQYKRMVVNGNVIRIPYENKKFRKLLSRAIRFWKDNES